MQARFFTQLATWEAYHNLIVFPWKSYVEALIPNVVIFENGEFGR